MKKVLIGLLMFMMSLQNSFATTITYQGSFQNCVDQKRIVLDESELKMPGDHTKETIEFKNVLNQPITLKLLVDEKVDTSYEMNIYQNGKMIYSCFANELKDGQEIVLGKIQKNQKCQFDFELKVPTDLDNTYTLTTHQANFKLIVEEETSIPNTGIYSNSTYLLIAFISIATIIVVGGKKRG